MTHSSPNRPSRDPHYFYFFARNILRGVPKENTVHEVLDFLKKILGSLSRTII